MLSLVVALVVSSPEVPPECQAPALRDVTGLTTFAQSSGSLSVGLDSVATWCFDSGGTWTAGQAPAKGKKIAPNAEPTGDCRKAVISFEAARASISAEQRQLLFDVLGELDKPFLGVKYKARRSGLAERPSEVAECNARDRSTLFTHAQARMDLARLSSQAQNEYANYRTWLFAEGLKCAQAVARGEKDFLQKRVAIDQPTQGGGQQVVPNDPNRRVIVAGSGSYGTGSGATGSGASGSGATGSGATGSGATGSGATGSGTTGSGATGSGAMGSGATGSGATGSGATGSGATGSGAVGSTNGSGAKGSGATGSGATGSGATGSTGSGAAGSGATGSGGATASGSGSGATVSGATGSGATGSGATGSGATGSGATGSGAATTGSGAKGSGAIGSTTGSGATGSGATGSGAAGSGATGSGATGSGATGSSATGSGTSAIGSGASGSGTDGQKFTSTGGTVPVGGPTAEREKALGSTMLEKWRYFFSEQQKIEVDVDWVGGFLASRELRDCKCIRPVPGDIVRRLENKDRVALLEADDAKNTQCELCLLDQFPKWKVRAQKQCSLALELSEFELGVLQRSDDGNGFPQRCADVANARRAGKPVPNVVITQNGTTGAPSKPPTGTGGSSFIITRTDQSDFVKPDEYAPIPSREEGRVYVRVFTSSACVAELLPGPVQARTGDLLPVPPAAKEITVRGACGGFAEVYFGREEKPRVAESFARNQPLRLQFRQ
ncbi:MAG: hypothetical protein JNM17_28565 [Archangium sp.]|nr:hypothetical protein [Archangium sp.]